MIGNTHKLLDILKNLRGILTSIEKITNNDLDNNYMRYCHKQATTIKDDDEVVNNLFDSVYNIDVTKRKGVNLSTINNLIIKYFGLLDDIDTAGDMFKPKQTFEFTLINQLHSLRWLYCVLEHQEGLITLNGEPYVKEFRVKIK